MKLRLMPKEASWWVWMSIVVLLGFGLAGRQELFLAAGAMSAASAGFHLWKHRSLAPYAVQIRLAYTALLFVCFAPALRWLYWLPAIGTVALLVFGYCLMARVLSLLPWNRIESVTPDLLRRTFLTPPQPGNPAHGLPGCVCDREARVAGRPRPSSGLPFTDLVQ